MSHVMRICVVSVVALTALLSSQGVAAEEEAVVTIVPSTRITVSMPTGAAAARVNPLGTKPLDSKRLSNRRGGTDAFNEMQLKGTVADNRAINVTTGSNVVTEGAFVGMVGLPLVVQNTGNNVLVQNATIINVQVK